MFKRILFLVVVFTCLTGIMLSPTFAELTSVNLTVSDRGVAFSLMKLTASSFFSVSVGDIAPYQPASRPVEVFPLMYVAAETNQPPETIWKEKKQHGWGRTAKEHGLPANSHGKYMSNQNKQKYSSTYTMNDADFQNASVVRFLYEYYDTDPTIIFYWRDHGLSYDDLFIGINLAARLHCEPRQFFQYRVSGRDWHYIAGKYHVSYDLLSQPVSPRNQLKLKKSPDTDYKNDGYKDTNKYYHKQKGKK